MLYVWIVKINILHYITVCYHHTNSYPRKKNKQLPHLASLTSDPWDPPNGDAGSELRASTAGATLDTVPGTHQRARWRTPETWRLHKREALGNPILGALHPRAWRSLDCFSAHTCDACCFRKPVFEDNRSESLVLVFFGPVANKQKWATRNSHSPIAENWASSFVLAHTHTRAHAHTHNYTKQSNCVCVCVCVYSLCQCTHTYQVELNAKTNFSRSSNSWIITRTNHLFKFHVTSQQESLPDTGLEKYWNMTK